MYKRLFLFTVALVGVMIVSFAYFRNLDQQANPQNSLFFKPRRLSGLRRLVRVKLARTWMLKRELQRIINLQMRSP